MNEKQRIAAAARVITAHRAIPGYSECSCKQKWTPLHVATMLDNAGLLCALHEETTSETELHQAFESIRALKAATKKEGITLK